VLDLDLLDLGNAIGILLANGHARSGHSQALKHLVWGSDEGASFVQLLTEKSRADLDRLSRDFLLFQEALHRLGPLLGARQDL